MRRLENLHHRNPPLLVDDECRDHTPLHAPFQHVRRVPHFSHHPTPEFIQPASEELRHDLDHPVSVFIAVFRSGGPGTEGDRHRDPETNPLSVNRRRSPRRSRSNGLTHRLFQSILVPVFRFGGRSHPPVLSDDKPQDQFPRLHERTRTHQRVDLPLHPRTKPVRTAAAEQGHPIGRRMNVALLGAKPQLLLSRRRGDQPEDESHLQLRFYGLPLRPSGRPFRRQGDRLAEPVGKMPLLAMRDLQIGQRPVFVDGEHNFDLRLIPDIVAIGRKPQVADHPDFEAFRTASLKRGVHLFGPKAGRRTGVFSGGLFLSGGFRGGRSHMQRRKAEKHHKQAFHNKAGVLGFINIAKNARLATARAQKKRVRRTETLLQPYRAVRPGTRFPIRGTKAECPRRPPNRPRRPRWDPWRASAGSSRDRPSGPRSATRGRPSGRPKRRPNRSAD